MTLGQCRKAGTAQRGGRSRRRPSDREGSGSGRLSADNAGCAPADRRVRHPANPAWAARARGWRHCRNLTGRRISLGCARAGLPQAVLFACRSRQATAIQNHGWDLKRFGFDKTQTALGPGFSTHFLRKPRQTFWNAFWSMRMFLSNLIMLQPAQSVTGSRRPTSAPGVAIMWAMRRADPAVRFMQHPDGFRCPGSWPTGTPGPMPPTRSRGRPAKVLRRHDPA